MAFIPDKQYSYLITYVFDTILSVSAPQTVIIPNEATTVSIFQSPSNTNHVPFMNESE